MSRVIILAIKTSHDDSLLALQSVIGSLARTGYVTLESRILTEDEKPHNSYSFMAAHAMCEAAEIDLYIEQTREGILGGDEGQAEGETGPHGLGQDPTEEAPEG